MRPKSSAAVEIQQRYRSGIAIDLDLGDVRARRISEVGRIIERGLVESRSRVSIE
jgi:hypothetical protein